jgi:hypothetical protein
MPPWPITKRQGTLFRFCYRHDGQTIPSPGSILIGESRSRRESSERARIGESHSRTSGRMRRKSNLAPTRTRQSVEKLIERDWVVTHPRPGSIVDRIGNGCGDPAHAELTDTFGLHWRHGRVDLVEKDPKIRRAAPPRRVATDQTRRTALDLGRRDTRGRAGRFKPRPRCAFFRS